MGTQLETDQSGNSALQLSVRYGEVWAHWPGMNSNVNLGPVRSVCEEMRRFISEIDRGK